MTKEAADALVAMFNYLEDRVSLIRGRQPHDHRQFEVLMARIHECVTEEPRDDAA